MEQTRIFVLCLFFVFQISHVCSYAQLTSVNQVKDNVPLLGSYWPRRNGSGHYLLRSVKAKARACIFTAITHQIPALLPAESG